MIFLIYHRFIGLFDPLRLHHPMPSDTVQYGLRRRLFFAR